MARQDVPDALGKRVPAEAVALVWFDALDTLEPKLQTFMNAVEPRAADEANLNGLLMMAGLSRDQVDGGKPLAVALTLGEGGRPLPTFIIPLKDGTYSGEPGNAVPALAKDLPGGDVAVRVDLERLIPQVRPMIEKALDPNQFKDEPGVANDAAALEMINTMMGWAKEIVYSGEILEVAASLDGGKVDYNMAFTVLEGSALDTPPTPGPALSDLVPSFDAGSRAMVFLLRADWSDAIDTFVPFYDQMLASAPQEAKDAFKAYLPKMREIYKLMGTTFVAGIDFGEDGMRMDGVVKPGDPDLYLSRYKALMEQSNPFLKEIGFALDTAPSVEVDGTKFDVFTMSMDMGKLLGGSMGPGDLEEMNEFMDRFMEALFGPEGMKVGQGRVGDYVVMSTAPFEPAVKVAKARSGRLPPAVAKALADDTSFFLHIDMQKLLAGVIELGAKAMPEHFTSKSSTGDPVHVWLRGSQTGRTYALGMHVDIGGIVAAVKRMD